MQENTQINTSAYNTATDCVLVTVLSINIVHHFVKLAISRRLLPAEYDYLKLYSVINSGMETAIKTAVDALTNNDPDVGKRYVVLTVTPELIFNIEVWRSFTESKIYLNLKDEAYGVQVVVCFNFQNGFSPNQEVNVTFFYDEEAVSAVCFTRERYSTLHCKRNAQLITHDLITPLFTWYPFAMNHWSVKCLDVEPKKKKKKDKKSSTPETISVKQDRSIYDSITLFLRRTLGR